MDPCAVCGKPASFICSRCKATPYCSAEHQVADWKNHKKRCFKPADTPEEATDYGKRLLLAIQEEAVEKALGLIAAGADVNIQDEKGSTPLMAAAAYNLPSIVAALLQKDASNINAANKYNQTALMYALNNKYEEVALQLIGAGADYKINYGPTQESRILEMSRVKDVLKEQGFRPAAVGGRRRKTYRKKGSRKYRRRI